MVSALRDIVHNPGRLRRVILYWSFRDATHSEFFRSLLEDIYAHRASGAGDRRLVVEIRHFVTTATRDDRNLGAILLHVAANAVHAQTGLDIFLNQQCHEQIQVGRPRWEKELFRVARICQELRVPSCGVYLCGAPALSDDVSKACANVTTQTNRRATADQQPVHIYFSKETFS
jgi:hypothetical protein